jgi:hypothetical protein
MNLTQTKEKLEKYRVYVEGEHEKLAEKESGVGTTLKTSGEIHPKRVENYTQNE